MMLPFLPLTQFKPGFPAPHGIDLYWLDLNEISLSEILLESLTPKEKAASRRYRAPERQQISIHSRGTLRFLLSTYLQQPPNSIEITENAYQKPVLAQPHGYFFNLSHTARFILFAVCATAPLGVDLEQMQRETDWQMIARRYFASEEQSFIAASPQPRQAFYQIWTAREAFLKGLGSGFHFPLDQFFVHFTDTQHAVIKSEQLPAAQNWKIESFHLEANCIAALAYPGEQQRLRTYRISACWLKEIAAYWQTH